MTKQHRNLFLFAGLGAGGIVFLFLITSLIGIAYYVSHRDKSVTVDHVTVKYGREITEQEAEKLAAWFSKTSKEENRTDPITIRLGKRDSTYEVSIRLKKGMEADNLYAISMRIAAGTAGREAFGGAHCDFVGCDENWNVLRVYPGN